MNEIEAKPLTDEQRAKFLEVIRTDKVGTREALRRAGVNAGASTLAVTHAYAKALLAADDELRRDYEIARGRDPETPEGVLFEVMTDNKNPRRLDAAKFWLERRHPDYKPTSTLDVNHSGGIDNPDVAAAIERFTALADAAIRAATDGRARGTVSNADGPAESRAGLPVGGLAGTT